MLRWLLSYALNAKSALLPIGTLLANLLGGYLIGLAAAALAAHPSVSPALRLFLVTGFFGGLTTFSILLHTGGSLLMTALGILSWRITAPILSRLF